MINIIGTYECKADAKGRVMFPAALKKQLNKIIDDSFVIKRSVFNQCLEIHPMQEWNKVIGQVNQLNRFVKKNNDFIRSYMAGLKVVEVDSSGRFLIPKDLLSFAGLEKEIVLSSSVNMIEIWDKDNYEFSISETLKDFGNLAEDVMRDRPMGPSDEIS
ncbi:MAG: division/cell wall cluster transcriptional repressor MraZ [Flavobacteriales bacterium]|nr:division/cell wall cluster transcriptional repressor MraZ [Flavobacteriales bacterium]MAU37656.1 division/cell wall cluster transcriptional repressor MraZ [Flavobacteriales bacterium]